MRFIITILLVISFSNFVNAQREKFDCIIQFVGSDTKSAEYIFLKTDSNDDNVNPGSLEGKLHIDRGNGKEKIKEDSIEYLEFIDLQNNPRIFLSEKLAGVANPDENLIEKIEEGKLTLYRDISVSDYYKAAAGAVLGGIAGGVMGSALAGGTGMYFYIPVTQDQSAFVYFWLKKEDSELIPVSLMSKQQIFEFMKDREDLHERIKHVNDPNMFITIIRDYNRGLEGTQNRLIKQHWDELYGRLKRVERQEQIDTIQAKPDNIKKGQYAIYKARSGEDYFCQIKQVVNSRFAKIQYEKYVGNKKEFMVPIKDILIIENGLIDEFE